MNVICDNFIVCQTRYTIELVAEEKQLITLKIISLDFCTNPYQINFIEKLLVVVKSRYLILGEYEFCFSNEFSTYAHKTVYMDFQSGKEPLLPIRGGRGMEEGQIALTMIESSTIQIHESLKVIIDYQTHHRLREGKSRSTAEYLFERVNYWSIGQTVVIVAMSLIQVYTLRNFFATKRDRI